MNIALGRGIVGGGIGAGVVTVYLTIRTRIKDAIASMGLNESNASAESSETGKDVRDLSR